MTNRIAVLASAAAFVAVAAVAGSPRTAGASGAVSETRAVAGAFDRIRVDGVFATDVRVGGPPHVVVSGDASVVQRVTVSVAHGELVVGMKSGSYSGSLPTKLAIALPHLRAFANEGAGSARIAGVTGEFELSNAGTATIVAAGTSPKLTVELDGTGTIDTTALDARRVTVDNNGVGSVTVRASGDLTMNVNGVGDIRYAGTPTHVESHVAGVGRITRL